MRTPLGLGNNRNQGITGCDLTQEKNPRQTGDLTQEQLPATD